MTEPEKPTREDLDRAREAWLYIRDLYGPDDPEALRLRDEYRRVFKARNPDAEPEGDES